MSIELVKALIVLARIKTAVKIVRWKISAAARFRASETKG